MSYKANNSENIDPEQWFYEGEWTELPEVHRMAAEERLENKEGIHERIQAEIQHEEKEADVMAKEMLDTPLVWNEVPDPMMETKDGRMIREAATKQKRDEVACGRRKRQREDDNRPEKCEHSLMVSRRTMNSVGLYSEDWDELQEEEDEWQMPDKWLKILHLGFYGGCLKIHPMRLDVYQAPVLNTKEGGKHM